MNEEALLHEARLLPLAERAAFLRKTCGDDHTLRQRIEAQLLASNNTVDYLALPSEAKTTAVDETPPSAPKQISKSVRRNRKTVPIVAALLFVMVLALGGLGWMTWDRTQRAETGQTMSEGLGRAKELVAQARQLPMTTSQEASAAVRVWEKAEAVLAEAEAAQLTGVSGGGRPGHVRGRHALGRSNKVRKNMKQRYTHKCLRKEKLLHALDAARLRRSSWSGGRFDYADAAMQYWAAFAAYELEVRPERTAELARRIRAEEPTIRDALLVALDDWMYVAAMVAELRARNRIVVLTPSPRIPWEPSAAELQTLADAADDDVWRRQFRFAVSARDGATFRKLNVVGSPLPTLPPAGLDLLALCLRDVAERDEALALLRWSRIQHPTDFFIPFSLGTLLFREVERTPPVELEESIGCFRSALALRPQSSVVHSNLGAVLYEKNLDEAIAECRKAIDFDPNNALAYTNLGNALGAKKQFDDALAAHKKAFELAPNLAEVNLGLGNARKDKHQWDAAIALYGKCLQLNPQYVVAYCNLGLTLAAKNQWDDAIAEYQKALTINPKYAKAHIGLGMAYFAKKQVDDAIAEYLKAIALDPTLVEAHGNLANALRAKNQLDAAIVEYRKVIELAPTDALAYYNLGLALMAKNLLDDAITAFRRAIQYAPQFAQAHYELATALKTKNLLDEALKEYRKVIQLDSNHLLAHFNLANVLTSKLQLDEAIIEFRIAIKLDPKFSTPHNNLANVLKAKNLLDDAVAEYQKAIELQPNFPEAYCNLGAVLRLQGRFAEALVAYRHGHEQGSTRTDWRYPSAEWVKRTEREVALAEKLPQLQAGEYRPKDNDERLALAVVCHLKQWHRAAAGLYADAFADDPKLADDLKTGLRFNAASYAVLAASGRGTDADKLDPTERVRLRKQALDWLRADLELWSKRLEEGKPQDRAGVRKALLFWQNVADLASVRDAEALKTLPTDEQEAWRKLWVDVGNVFIKAGDAG